MTLEEAKKVAKVLSNCDGNCPVCVRELTNIIQEEFPEFIWKYDNDIVVSQKE